MDPKEVLKGKKILVAEDDEANTALMKDILSQMECEATFVKNGNEAVDAYLHGQFDLILMDIRMPEKDGMQAAREIRNAEKGKPPVPIIALTASATPNEVASFEDAGIKKTIEKPIDLAKMRQTMANILSGESSE